MLSASFIEELHCPYCASPLVVERTIEAQGAGIVHGVAQCGCYRYPVIDGILILKQQSGPADTSDARVEHLLAGDIAQARHRAMHVDSPLAAGPGRWQRVLRGAAARGVPMAAALAQRLSGAAGGGYSEFEGTFAELLETLRPGLYAQYLYQRYANNSFLASIAPLLLLGDLDPGQRVLELTCGIGHSAFLMHTLFPQLQIVATDHDFVNLSIAKRHFVPDAQLVCLDAEAPLPFADRTFGGVFCLDGFHYLRSKVALIAELDRVAEREALWLLPHLHNARAENFNPGIPLTAEHYGRCFTHVPHRIFNESALLSEFHGRGMLALDREPSQEEVAQAQNLTLIGSRRQELWCARADLAQHLVNRPDHLIVNPIYDVRHEGHVTRLKLSWPSDRLRDECREVEAYLPDSLELDTGLLHRLRSNALEPADLAIVRELAHKFILVNLPAAAYAQVA